MLAVLIAQLRHRLARTIALFLALLVATTAFAVLTGATQASRLVVTGAVEQNFRPAYDILVRPAGSRTDVETKDGLVRESYLSTQASGGITWDQLYAVRSIPGVAVAAPAAILGYVMQTVQVPLNVEQFLGGATRKVLRLDVSRVADSGLTTVPGERTVYVYVTDQPLKQLDVTGAGVSIPDPYGPTEQIDGRSVIVCPYSREDSQPGPADPFSEVRRTEAMCVSTADRTVTREGSVTQTAGHYPNVEIPWSFPYLVAAIDPEAEAALVGLDSAVTAGRYLEAGEHVRMFDMPGPADVKKQQGRELPLLRASRPFAAGEDRIAVSLLGSDAVQVMTTAESRAQQRQALAPLTGAPVGDVDLSTSQAFAELPGIETPEEADARRETSNPFLASLWSVGAPTVTALDGNALSVEPGAVDPKVWDFPAFSQDFRPLMETLDLPFRTVKKFDGDNGSSGTNGQQEPFKIPSARVVGTFDPEKVQTGAELASVPLSLYTPSVLVGGDAASKAALKDGPLKPNGSMIGYAQEPPMMLTSIQAMRDVKLGTAYPGMEGVEKAPFGSIRIKVDGAVGVDSVSRERVRLIADRIATSTGLDVDIVTGSSPTAVQVALPGGKFGRPDLVLQESWVKKGVAVQLLQAVDRKSVALFGLILVVCGFFVTNAVTAAVRERRRELAVLSALGWSRAALARQLLGEIGLIGLAAGVAGALLSWPLSALLGVEVSWWRPLVAIPAAVALALLAGLAPVLRAARVQPAQAFAGDTAKVRRAGTSGGVVGLALRNVLRMPGRALIGGAGLAVGVAALTLVLGVTQAFSGAAVGTVLGDALTLAVRPVDVVAVVTIVVLGAFATADVLFLAVRERATEFATLRAVGWAESAIRRLVIVEGLAIATLGAMLGAAVGMLGLELFVGGSLNRLIPPTLLAAGAGVVLTLLALTVPVTALRRLNTARVLAEEN